MSPRETPVEGASTPIRTDFAKIPLPPEGAEGETPAKDAAPVAAEEIAVISFLDLSARPKEIPLEFPFEWDGRQIASVTARRLTLADVVRVSEAAPKDAEGSIALVHFYAAMTGLPAAVIRALEADDSQRVQEGCFPFLPRSITGSISRSTGET